MVAFGIIRRGPIMKKMLAAGALVSMALAAPAYAADLPVKAPPPVAPALYNWSGVYIGVEGGAVMGQRTDWFFTFPECSLCAQNFGHPLHGGFAGGEAGVTWQAPGSRWVFGIEGDGSWSELEEALADAFAPFSVGSRIRDFETVRGRIGYALVRGVISWFL
jgi:outer membrane immunogenic protein